MHSEHTSLCSATYLRSTTLTTWHHAHRYFSIFQQLINISHSPAVWLTAANLQQWLDGTDRQRDREGDRQTERWTVRAVLLTKITGPLTLYLNQALRNVELTLAQKVLYDDAVNILSSLFAFKCLVDIDCIEVRSEVLQNNEQECV